MNPTYSLLLSLFNSGIRAGSGNVMLYGPAGTGKTIMCQAAAYEAKAELIIGIITIIAILSANICAKLYIRLFHIYYVITHLSSHYVILFSQFCFVLI